MSKGLEIRTWGGKLELYFGTKNGVLLPIARRGRGREEGGCIVVDKSMEVWPEEVFLLLNFVGRHVTHGLGLLKQCYLP